jgi:hypothetical protein
MFMYIIYNSIQIGNNCLYTTAIHISPIFLLTNAAAVATMIAGNTHESIRCQIFDKRQKAFLTPAQAVNQIDHSPRPAIRHTFKHTDRQSIKL